MAQTAPAGENAYLKVMSWNFDLNKSAELKKMYPFLITSRKEPTKKKFDFLAGTMVLEKPALLLCQEVKADTSTVIDKLICKAVTNPPWKSIEQPGPNNEDEAYLKKYKVTGARLSYHVAGASGFHGVETSPGANNDVAVMVHPDKLTVCDRCTDETHSQLSQGFPKFLLEEMEVLKSLPCFTKQEEEEEEEKEKDELKFDQILKHSAWVCVETKATATATATKFLAMSIHMPNAKRKNVYLAAAVLRAAFRFADDQQLPFLVGGDWNTPVGGIVEHLGKDVEVMIRLLNDAQSRHCLDGFFLCNGGEAAPADSCKIYRWSSGNDDGYRGAHLRSETFGNLVLKQNSGHADTEGTEIAEDATFRKEAGTVYGTPGEHLPIMLKLASQNVPAILAIPANIAALANGLQKMDMNRETGKAEEAEPGDDAGEAREV